MQTSEQAWQSMSLRTITLKDGLLRMIFDPTGVEVRLPFNKGDNLGEVMATLQTTAEAIRTRTVGMQGVILTQSAMCGLFTLLNGLRGVDLPSNEVDPVMLKHLQTLHTELSAAYGRGFGPPR